jgi:hypothetical protein
MGKAEKLAAKILSGKVDKNSLSMTSAMFSSALGSSRALEKEVIGFITKREWSRFMNVQPRNGKAKPYQVKQVRELLLKYNIDIE